jgi:flagellar protein FlaF
MTVAAYRRTIRESESPRQIERRILSEITGRMEDAATAFDRTPSREARAGLLSAGLREALADNQALWIALRDDLAQPANALPPSLRAALISIALWVERQTAQVLGGSPGISVLVEVNNNIIAGLSGQAPGPRGVR